MAYLYKDLFNGSGDFTARTPDIGGAYTGDGFGNTPPSLLTVDGAGSVPMYSPWTGAENTSAASTMTAAIGDTGAYELKFTVTGIPAGAGGDSSLELVACLAAELASPNSYALLRMVNKTGSGGAAYLVEINNGVTTWATSATSTPFVSTGSTQTLRVETSASGVVVKLDGTIVATDAIVSDVLLDAVVITANALTGVGAWATMDEASVFGGAGAFWTSTVKTTEVDA